MNFSLECVPDPGPDFYLSPIGEMQRGGVRWSGQRAPGRWSLPSGFSRLGWVEDSSSTWSREA